MFPEDWQVGFVVKGLRAPDEIMLDDSIIIQGSIHDDAKVFFKETIDDENDKNDLGDISRSKLEKIIQIYGLVSNRYASVQGGTSANKISSESPFGQPGISIGLRLVPVATNKQRDDNVSLLKKTLEKHNLIKTICQNRRKRFLLNAIDYYHRSIGDSNREEKLIDSMICLESLFSRESQELRLRYSLRIAHLLGANQQENLPDIFRNVYSLYKKRNSVIHGVEDVELHDKDIWIFQMNLREAIKIFIHVEVTKVKLLLLLDESVYDLEKREQLRQIVSQAIKKW